MCGVFSSFCVAFFRYFVILHGVFSLFRLFAWRFFVISLCRVALFRYFVFSRGVISLFRYFAWRYFVAKRRKDEMAQISHHRYIQNNLYIFMALMSYVRQKIRISISLNFVKPLVD